MEAFKKNYNYFFKWHAKQRMDELSLMTLYPCRGMSKRWMHHPRLFTTPSIDVHCTYLTAEHRRLLLLPLPQIVVLLVPIGHHHHQRESRRLSTIK